MPSARYLASKGKAPATPIAVTKRFEGAVPHILIPRCQAEVDGRQCKNAATRPARMDVNGVIRADVWCGQHYKGLPRGR